MNERVTNKETVLVDMDGVLADFDGFIFDRLPSGIIKVVRKDFYITGDYPEHHDLIYEIAGHETFFHDLPVMENALEGWQRLVDLGYDPRICSAPMAHNKQSVEGKREWLRRHLAPVFGKQVVERAYIDTAKYKYEGLVLIDDRPVIDTNEGQATWQHVVFDHEYNQESNAELRLHGWLDPNLEETLEEAKRRKATNR